MSVLFPSIVSHPHCADTETLACSHTLSAVVDTGKLSGISGGTRPGC